MNLKKTFTESFFNEALRRNKNELVLTRLTPHGYEMKTQIMLVQVSCLWNEFCSHYTRHIDSGAQAPPAMLS